MYSDKDVAIQDVENSKIWGVLTFPCNYSANFKERAMFGINAEMDAVLGSRLNFQIDVSS